MSRRDEAAEAMAEAMDTAYNPDLYPIMTAMFRDYAETALDAALAVLHPTVPNSVEVLDALPRGTVLRGEDHEGTPWMASLTPVFDSAQSVPYWRNMGITSWQVLWTPEQDQFTTKETK